MGVFTLYQKLNNEFDYRHNRTKYELSSHLMLYFSTTKKNFKWIKIKFIHEKLKSCCAREVNSFTSPFLLLRSYSTLFFGSVFSIMPSSGSFSTFCFLILFRCCSKYGKKSRSNKLLYTFLWLLMVFIVKCLREQRATFSVFFCWL